MKKIEYAWIEQIVSFHDSVEKQKYIDSKNDSLNRKHCSLLIVDEWTDHEADRLFIRIRLPYNNSEILEGDLK